jgi:serine/threonine protein kinase
MKMKIETIITEIKENLLDDGSIIWWDAKKKRKVRKLKSLFNDLSNDIYYDSELGKIFMEANGVLIALDDFYNGRKIEQILNEKNIDLKSIDSKEFNYQLLSLVNYFSSPLFKITQIVKQIDSELKFKEIISDKGGYSFIVLVDYKGMDCILKINKRHEDYERKIGRNANIVNEYNVFKDLQVIRYNEKDLRAIPKVYKFYDKAPSIESENKLGKNAYLMEFINGKTLYDSGKQGVSFFVQLKKIINLILDEEYLPPILDLNPQNILVDENNNPVLIDFMCAQELSDNENFAFEQKKLVRQRIDSIIARYEL